MKISILPAASIDNASARLRAFKLSDALAAAGQEAAVKVMSDADVLFIHKRLTDDILKYARLIKDGGGVVIYDLDNTADEMLGRLNISPEQWQEMLSLADIVTTDTRARQEILQQAFAGTEICVLPNGIDYYPATPLPPSIASGRRLQVLWFGYVDNLFQIAPYVDTLRSLDLELHIAAEAEAIPQLESLLPGVDVFAWQLDTFPDRLRQCDLALLIQQGDTHDRAKSNQKMLACIANGVVPIVSHTPEYLALAQEIDAQDSVFSTPEELAEAIGHYSGTDARSSYLDRAQPLVFNRFCPAEIARSFLETVATAQRRKNGRQTLPITLPSEPTSLTRQEAALNLCPAGEARQPLVSVIIPTKDRPHLLAQALQSLQYQSYQRFEAVVVNDGGCEIGNLVDFYSRHFDVVYVRHPHSTGAAAARNTALRLSKGDIIAYLDDDDYFLSSHLETVVDALKDSRVDFVYTDAEYVVFKLEDGRPVEKTRARPYQSRSYSRDELLIANYIPTPTWAHRAGLIKRIGDFDESMRILEDWDFLIRASAATPLLKIERQTVEVRQATFRSDHTLPAATQQISGFQQIYARYPDVSISVSLLRRKLLSQLENPAGPEAVEPLPDFEKDYDLWVAKHSLEQIHAQIYAEHLMRWPAKPRFVMLVPVRRDELEKMAKSIASLQLQLYQEWQLIVIADFDAPSSVFEQSDILGWLRIDDLSNDEQLIAACNGAIDAIPCDWIALLPPGTELEPHAFLALSDYAFLRPEWQAIYTDHDHLTDNGKRIHPWFKPDFNLDYFRSMDYVGSAVWFRAQALKELGGFNVCPGAWQYDALWRMHDRRGAAAIGHIAEPLTRLPTGLNEHPLANAARQVALESHLARQGSSAVVSAGLLPGTFRVEHPLGATPLVSIIIPNRDCVWYLQPCIDSLFEKTDYPNFEVVIVDNQTEDPDTLAYYDELREKHGERVRIVAYNHPFNFAAQCNLGARESRGDYLLLLNNDTEVIQSAWLSRLVAHGLRTEVGIVGARLVFPETGKIQHAGVVLGLDRLASHGFMNLDMNDPGYMNRLQVEQDYSAVTAACMLIRKELYESVGGMDAEQSPVLFNDVDLCLKVRAQGHLVVWTPYVTLVHHESKSIATEMQELQKRAAAAKRDESTADALHQRWHAWLREDPAYNRHLALSTSKSFHVEAELVADWDCNFHDRPRLLAFPIAGGVGEYRFIAPLRALAHDGRLQHTLVQTKKYHQLRYPTLPELSRLAPDVLMQQVDYSPSFREWQAFYRRHRPEMLSVIMIDDLITHMPKDNPNYRLIPKDGRQRLRKLFALVDRVIVSTEPLREFVGELIEDVRLVPNTLRDDLWGNLTSRRRAGPKPRVGWAGAQQHKGDLAIIIEAVKQTANELDWIFFGMCPDEIRPYIKEFHPFEVGVEAYPAKLASLNLDLAVAPLEIHPFNEAKSNLRLLEYGILGLPVICTDILPYRTDNAPVKRVANETRAWVEAIRERIHDLDATAREGDLLQSWVRKNYMLSDHLDSWFHALTDPRA